MTINPRKALPLLVLAISCAITLAAQAQQPAAAGGPGVPTRSLGTIKTIAGSALTLTTDSGTEVSVTVQPDATLVKTAPGRKDLQGATPIQLADVKAGDRILVRGKYADDGKSIVASSAIVMKHEDIAQKQQQEQDDWRRRGINGVVDSVDPAAGVITVSTGSITKKKVAVHVAPTTILRRYAPDSIKFDDAKVSTLAQINAGDQLRARGDRSADGNDFTAEEVVSGTFRNLAGTVISTNAADNSVTINDLVTKKPITVKISADSQMRKLPPMIAQGIAMRLKGGAPGATPGGAPAPGGAAGGPPPGGMGAGGPGGAPGAGGFRAGGQGDVQQMLGRMPAVALTDLQKGDAVIILSTEGTASSAPTAITLLSGVEPILTASPADNRAAMTLSPWSFSAPSGDAGP